MITYSGAAGIMVSDSLERYNLELSTLSSETIHEVAKLSPEWMPLGNPLDIWPAVMKHGTQKAYSIALNAVMKDPQVDAVICIAIAPKLPEFSFLEVSRTLNKAVEGLPPKPVVGWLYGPNPEEISKKYESKKRIMIYPTLDLAAWSLSLLRKQ